MILLFASLLLPGYAPGDHWTIERTIHCGAQTQVEWVTYRVEDANMERNIISQVVSKVGHPDVVASRITLKFRLDGTLIGDEPVQDPILMRLFRIEWTAVEGTSGLEWSRTWKTQKTIGKGTVTIRPTGFLNDGSESFKVTYKEANAKVGRGTASVFYAPNAADNLDLTFASLPGDKTNKAWTITERLKDRTLRDSG